MLLKLNQFYSRKKLTLFNVAKYTIWYLKRVINYNSMQISFDYNLQENSFFNKNNTLYLINQETDYDILWGNIYTMIT